MTDLEAENAQLRDELAEWKRHARRWEAHAKRKHGMLVRALRALDRAADDIRDELEADA